MAVHCWASDAAAAVGAVAEPTIDTAGQSEAGADAASVLQFPSNTLPLPERRQGSAAAAQPGVAKEIDWLHSGSSAAAEAQ